jgi:DNA mismatch repair protein MutS
MAELTPLMKQYFSIKNKYKDAIVFFRLGDFYEMFGEDAEKASKILQIALTSRDKTKDEPIPMCGIPYFASETYISKLINAGYKVAICEQLEDAKDSKGIVERDIVRIITPGTHSPENPRENIYIASIMPDKNKHGIAIADISTGEFIIYETDKDIKDELYRFNPKELVIPSSISKNIYYSELVNEFFISPFDDWYFEFSESYKILLKYLKVASLEGFGCEGMNSAISAAGALINYLNETQKGSFILKKIKTLSQESYMFLDASAQKNLELINNLRNGSNEETLLWVLDETLTPMGSRFLKSSLLKPLIDINEIKNRQDAVHYLYEDFLLLEELRNNLRKIQDIERLTIKINSKTANARDLVALKNSLIILPKIKNLLLKADNNYIRELSNDIYNFDKIIKLIDDGIMNNPPLNVKEGGIIKDGFDPEIDDLRNISKKGKEIISNIESKEREKTGISSLKVGYNKLYGYYIEVTKPNLHMVPEYYIRKQTLIGSERFITQELKEYETKVISSEERLKTLEYQLFINILNQLSEETNKLFQTSHSIAVLDFLSSLAIVAKRHNYVKPTIDNNGIIDIIEGRHPVLERTLTESKFIPNNAYMDMEDNRLLIITGPNMAGKSTYMRQIALIIIMAQIGSFVPATSAKLGIVDRIFTRIGASDYLTKNQSTFMVEMIEVANIVNNASENSIIILDEVGRGTSTFDGISIAWAVAEYILKKIKAKTLFATHYNELTELGIIHKGVKNYNISVKEWGDEIIFLRKIEKGAADKSYGIQVARLAGIPDEILNRAKEVLANLEKEELDEIGRPKFINDKYNKEITQLDLFSSINDSIISEIKQLDIENLSPEDALNKLKELKRRLNL